MVIGHSRTIVGIELGKTTSNLLIFDPGTKKAQIEKSKHKSVISLFRRCTATFKKKEYQLLLIRGVINSNEEYEVNIYKFLKFLLYSQNFL